MSRFLFLFVGGALCRIHRHNARRIVTPLPNEHAARVRSPDAFQPDSFRRQALGTGGVAAIMGRLKGETTMTVQSYRFPKDKFTPAQARAWLAEHDVEGYTFEPATEETRRESMNLSDDNKRNLLRLALVSEYGMGTESPIPKKLAVEEVFADRLIYNVDGQLYEADYEIDGDAVTLGEPKKVTSTRIFKAMEVLQTRYAELIQEVGKRNALKDAGRVRKILELCQELLSSEPEPDEKKTQEALREVADVTALLMEAEVVKEESGAKYPASAFAYVPNVHKPGTWKLRMWEDMDKKVTKAQLGRAAAALSPGGLAGQKTLIPAGDLPSVKRKLRTEYRRLKVAEDDIPKWVKETETRELLRSYVPLTEATFDKGRATVIVIKPGFNATEDRYYPADMLKRDYKVFEGQKMYADHPTDEEDKARPERSIKDWVATLTGVEVDEAGVVTGTAEIVEPWLMTKLASLRDKKLLSEMGISINAVGSATKDTIDGKDTLVIEKLVSCRSVDFVTEPGAGGEVTLYEADRNRDIELVELSGLRERRPDLVKAIEAAVRAEYQQEVKQKMDQDERIKELEDQNTTLTTERDGLQTKVEEVEKARVKAEAQAAIKEAVEKADLPQAAKDRLIAMNANAETADNIEEAIKAEVEYIGRLSESGKVRGMGSTQADSKQSRVALVESFVLSGLSEEQAEVAAAGR